ncbi:hypothetical protein, partial [Klebsiella quasipneumoniae]|uniref:hypothetical protein n=1 Tax=Klebsiella quasipneumoniae TaxID=1463165 RepID=UPI002731AB1D
MTGLNEGGKHRGILKDDVHKHTFASLYINREGLLVSFSFLVKCGMEYGYDGVILLLRQGVA